MELVSFIKKNYGINLENKRVLIEGRLASLLKEKGCQDFSDYIKIIKADRSGVEVNVMLNKVTTNHTFFMREPNHFTFLKNTILPAHEKENKRKEIRIWSAGCSVGAEAYTTAMTIDDYFGIRKKEWKTQILATDISMDVLNKGRAGVYPGDLIKDVPPAWQKKYFVPMENNQFQVANNIRQEVEFKTLNLMGNLNFGKKFHLIFCRNVMIYFDQPTRNTLINKFYDVLEPKGYLFIGHSESITRGTSQFEYLMPAIYQKGE